MQNVMYRYRFGDGRHVDLLRYVAWLIEVRHKPRPEPEGDPYEKAKERARARNAALALAGRDIGELPEVVDPERKARAAVDFRFFCESYFPLTFHLPWSADHLKVISKIEQAVIHGGLFAMACPRGTGKSSICESACIWAVLNGHRDFVCLIGSDEGHAMDMLDAIKTELDGNDLLLADFPEVVYPIQCLAGPGKKISGIMPCTVIRPGDMADSILCRQQHPEWNGERTKMVYAFPDDEKRWQRYAELRAESLRMYGDIRLATEYYAAHRLAMDDGANVAWPERYNHDELSAIQHAMNLKLQDEAAFFAEYQNEPLAAIEIAFGGEREEFRATFSPEGLYGLGREKGHMLGPGDGLYGAAIADAVREWGTLHQLVYDDVDLRAYSASRCRDYGRRGVPRALKTLAAEHRVTHAARVNTADEGWALLGAGYTINMCSSLGFQGRRDAEGVIRRRGSWSHSMAVTSRRTTQSGNRLVLVHQSWGDNWTDGPYWQDMPWGSFWIHLADFGVAIGQRDSFAHARYQGFLPRQLPDFATKEYLG